MCWVALSLCSCAASVSSASRPWVRLSCLWICSACCLCRVFSLSASSWRVVAISRSRRTNLQRAWHWFHHDCVIMTISVSLWPHQGVGHWCYYKNGVTWLCYSALKSTIAGNFWQSKFRTACKFTRTCMYCKYGSSLRRKLIFVLKIDTQIIQVPYSQVILEKINFAIYLEANAILAKLQLHIIIIIKLYNLSFAKWLPNCYIIPSTGHLMISQSCSVDLSSRLPLPEVFRRLTMASAPSLSCNVSTWADSYVRYERGHVVWSCVCVKARVNNKWQKTFQNECTNGEDASRIYIATL